MASPPLAPTHPASSFGHFPCQSTRSKHLGMCEGHHKWLSQGLGLPGSQELVGQDQENPKWKGSILTASSAGPWTFSPPRFWPSQPSQWWPGKAQPLYKKARNRMNEHFYWYWPLSLTTVTKGEKTFAGGGARCCPESLGWDWGSQVPSRSPIPVDRLTQPPASLGERGFSSYTLKGNRWGCFSLSSGVSP